MKDFLLVFGFAYLFFSFDVSGQVVLENNPTSIKWQQVNTKNFKVLFPRGFDQQAQRVANTLEHIHKAESRTLGSTPRRISVILQNQSSESNGFVSILPRRSEFYTMPPQDYNFLGTNDWLNQLAAHEYRHIVQYQHAIRGFNRVIYYLFGSTGLTGMAHVAAPNWFWEGDAVVTETAFTRSGRGRIPNFNLVFKSNLLEGRTFNYHKQYLGSYKHNIPDYYVLGYNMVSYLRRKTNDPEIWGKITARSWNVPFIPFAFSNAIHKETGLYVTDLFRETTNDLKKEWQEEVNKLEISKFEKVNPRRSQAYTDYVYPQVLDDGSILAMKRGISDIEQFVRLANGSETKVFTPGFMNHAGMLSASKQKVVWSEYGYDPRWRVKNYSLIKVVDLVSGKKWIVGSKHDRLTGAALSPDARTVVAMRSDNNYQNSVVLLDVMTGQNVKIFPNPENNFYSMPRWSDDGKSIVMLKTTAAGRTISILEVASGAIRDVLEVTDENIGHPVLLGSHVFFNSPSSGVDNIYVLDLVTKKRWQVTSSRFGAYNPAVSPDGKTIYYNEQTRDGLDVVKIPFDPSHWQSYRVREQSQRELYDELALQEGRPHLFDSVPQNKLPLKKYSKISGIINPYNWGAFITNDLAQVNIGISSRDILSTTSITAGYLYDLNEGTSSWSAGVSYQGLYPIIDLEARIGDRSTEEDGFGNSLTFKWDEFTVEGGMRIPLLLTNSKYSRGVTLGNAVGLTQTSNFRNRITRNDTLVYDGPERINPAFDTLLFVYKDQLNDGDLLYNRFSFSIYNLLKRSRRDFLYRWGQTLDVDLYNTPYGGDFEGRLMAARATLYFPGFFKHHFLYTRFAYQESLQGVETNLYTFRNRIAKPRGHSYPDDETFYSLSVNYALPIWYPDIALGPILYIQRIKANCFYDFGQGTGSQYYYNPESNRAYFSTSDETYQSVGIETTFDFNVMRYFPKFELGFRTTYRFENSFNTSGVVFEFVIGNIGF